MDHKTLATFAWLIPAFPLISFFAILLFTRGKNRVSHTIAIGAMSISFVLAQIVFWSVMGNTLIYMVAVIVVAIGFGLGSALVLNRPSEDASRPFDRAAVHCRFHKFLAR